ncbi:PilT/PilU family type 4a pilus ATPase [Uruburuella suis]|uniref:PilT/PilU family type 4a pilus ATPase n=1 Tax=Uruburuella suis TaxID=252130 RepID=UPI003F4ABFCD
MNETNQLHALLSDMVAAYSSKKAPHIPTPAEIGAHLHPILDHMCADAEQRGASDIFISAGFPPSLKVNGTLTPVPHKSLSVQDTADIVTSTMNDEQLEEFNKNKDLNYAVQSRSNTRYRVNAYHDQGRVGLVLRRINQVIPTVEELSLPPVLHDLALRSRGLLILAGPTGSGKSTSMAAMVNHRNHKMPGHIVTIEDPIEYIYQPRRCIVTQREIGIDTPSWKLAVQNAMRQAPDVVCIGEVRNEDSMEYALQLAQTGHLCICTLHASTANQAIERIMNFYQEDRRHQVLMDVALNLVGIIGQRLVVKKDKKGRTAIIDLLINNAAVQDLIFKGELMGIKDIMLRSGTEGMQTFDQNLFELYVAGQVDYDEALRQADSANDLRLRIQLYEEGGEPERLFDRISDLNLMS